MTSSNMPRDLTFKAAFDEETGLLAYAENALGLFALSMYLHIEDIDEFAAASLTAGPDDKKADACYIDENEGRAIVAQFYMAQDWGKPLPPSNKASDLNTAMGWLLSASEDLVPAHLVTKARELRRAIQSGAITRLELLLVHNCMASVNVQRELKVVADTTRDIILGITPESQIPVVVSYREFGLAEIEDLFRSRGSEILVDELLEVPCSQYAREQTADWSAILTSVPATWIRSLYKQHGDRLFSANYRDYLGYTRRSTNINYQMTQTAVSEPENFWVYNNGITALTLSLNLADTVTIQGMSIINGAQTTGALGDTPDTPSEHARVLIRIVQCTTPELVDKIIRYNNTQNEITPADRRSNDPTQRRLRADFQQYGIVYVHRRTTARIPHSAITAASIAPGLCAFHGDPQTSYRNASSIFNDDATYQKVFPSTLRVEHIFLVKALSTAIDSLKADLKKRVADQTATQVEMSEDEVLKYSASKHFIFYVCGQLAEQIMGRRVSDQHEWQALRQVISAENTSLTKAWGESLQGILPLLAQVVARQESPDPYYDVPRSMDLSKGVAKELEAIIASLQGPLASQFAPLRDRTTL